MKFVHACCKVSPIKLLDGSHMTKQLCMTCCVLKVFSVLHSFACVSILQRIHKTTIASVAITLIHKFVSIKPRPSRPSVSCLQYPS